MIKIDKNIPMPKKSEMSEVYATLGKLKVGDSFVAKINSLATLHNVAKSRFGITVTCRKQPNGTHRIWRTK